MECLDSVLTQTYQNFEIILINPHSSDGTDEICLNYQIKFPKIRLVRTPNQGQLLNRIAGFSIAHGKYLFCLDGDDYWAPNLLETIYLELQDCNSDWIIFGHKRVRDKKIIDMIEHVFPNRSVFQNTEKKKIYEKLIMGRPFNEMWSKVISKPLFEQIIKGENFIQYKSIRIGEDLLFNCYAAQYSKKILYLDYPMYCYRIRNNSISHKFRREELQDYITVKKKIREFMSDWQMDEPIYQNLFLLNISNYFMDWIYRCALSNLPYKEKKFLYKKLRKETLYLESLPYQKKIDISTRHKAFHILFRYNDFLLQCYAKIFLFFKKICRR